MTQIVQIIADLLQLNNAVIPGKLRNMDCLELFFQLKQLSETTEIKILSEPNKPWMQQLYAALLVIMIYKNSEDAFYDIVTWQEQQPEFSLMSGLTTYLSKSMVLAAFFDSSAFQPYFSQPRHQGNRVNQHIFLKSLSRYVGELSAETNLHGFAQECSAKLKDCDPLRFTTWYQHHPFFQTIEPSMLTLWFEAFQSMAAVQIAQHAGRIRASSLQLINLGYSPRAKRSHSTGGFNPMVNTEIAAINSVNIQAMVMFFDQNNHDQRLKLLQELFLGYLIDQQSKQPRKEPISQIDPIQSHAFTLFKPSSLKSSLPKAIRNCPTRLSAKQANPNNNLLNQIITHHL